MNSSYLAVGVLPTCSRLDEAVVVDMGITWLSQQKLKIHLNFTDYIVQKNLYQGLLLCGGDINMTHADKEYSVVTFFIVFLTGEQNQLTLIKIIQC